MSDTRAGDGTADTRAGDGTADTRAGDGTADTRAGDGTADTRAGDGTADTRAGDGTADTEPERPHARDRVGVIAGVLLGLLTLFFLIALAAMGFQPALGLLVVFSVGALLVAGGVRLHGPRR